MKYIDLEYPYYYFEYKYNKDKYLELFNEKYATIYHSIPPDLNKYKLEKFDNTYFIIYTNFANEYKVNSLTDYFTEKVRVRCMFGKHISPFEYWSNNQQKIIKDCEKYFEIVNVHNIREIIYKNAKLCNNFRITVCSAVLQYFKPKKWLDISAGWGDRMISAILNGVHLYVAADPNLDLHPHYEKIRRKLLPENKRKNFIIHPTGFLEAPIMVNNFDIVFSSPPFFDLEIYSNYPDDSLTKFKDPRMWCDEFLIPSIIKSYNLLKKGGHLVLYFGSNNSYINRRIQELNIFMKYIGIIYFYEKTPRAMYVWRKET